MAKPVEHDPFMEAPDVGASPQEQRKPALRVPQARVLCALMPKNPSLSSVHWPQLTRSLLATRAGYSPLSGTVTRALNGIRKGSSSGEAQTGLLVSGMVEAVEVDVDGVVEVYYRITPAGIGAYQEFLAAGGELPAVKDRSVFVNDRYKK